MKNIFAGIKTFYQKYYLPVILIIFLAACLSGIAAAPFWRDEAFSALVATGNWSDILATAVKDTQPPLHMLLLHLSYLLGGKSEILARLWSVLGAVLIIIFSCKISDKLFRQPKLGCYVAPLVAFNPVIYNYALEARSYALFTAMFVMGIYFALEYIENPGKLKAALLVLVSVIGLYLHNLYVICFAVIMLTLIWSRIKKLKKKPFRELLFDCKDIFVIGLIVVLLYLPWFFSLLSQYGQVSSNGFWLSFDFRSDFFKVLSQSFVGESYYISSLDLLGIILEASMLVSVCGVLLGWFDDLRTIRHKIPVLSLASLLPMLLIYLISFKTPFMYVRYLIFVIPFFVILVAAAYRNKAAILKILVILTLIFTSVTAIFTPVKKEDYKTMLSRLDYNAATDVVIHNDALPVFGFRYYSNIPSFIYAAEKDIPYYEGKAALSSADYWAGKDITTYSRVWVVTIYHQDNFYPRLEALGYKKISDEQFDGNLYLALFQK